MGGDNAPEAVVAGAVEAAEQLGVEVVLVGERGRILPLVESHDLYGRLIHVQHASETVGMDAHPTEAVRRQKDSSIVVATRLVKEGECDAVVSAGNTGVTMVASLMAFGRIAGIGRPAIGTVIPMPKAASILVDAGANVDSRPPHLVQFALMGSIYAERVLGVESPRVGLLSNGEEESKGTEVVVEVHRRLRELSGIHFIGNVEGRDILPGKADVIVCDGFVGNIVLKLMEGLGQGIVDILQEALRSSLPAMAGGLLAKPALKKLWKRLDYAEYGGAPLLGLQKMCIISHGSSNAKAIRNAVRVARESVERDVIPAIAARAGEEKLASVMKAGVRNE